MNKIYVRLAKTNMRNNRQLYVPYILSGLITVAMFYLMTFLSGNEGLAHARGAEMIGRILSFGVGIIGIFSYIFIFYTNSFISKRRKKEIGIYNILGMEKRHIGKVLAIETLYTSVLAIGGGIIGGIIFSKLMLMFLYRILDITTSVSFEISWQGIEYTIVLFGILYFLTFLYNYMQMKLANPMELLRGGNVGEKEPKTKVLMTLAGMVCLGIGYYIAFTTEKTLYYNNGINFYIYDFCLEDIKTLIDNIHDLKKMTDSQEYLLSSQANMKYNAMLPILDKELKRVSEEKLEVNAPAISIIEKTGKSPLTELINIELSKLVANDYKIIDYGITELEGKVLGYIKYTT